MKKIFKIANYDFKRLMFNPITLISLAVVLGIVFLCGLVIQSPNATEMSVKCQGTTTKAIYENFSTSYDTSFDSKFKLNSVLDEAQSYINVQSYAENDVIEYQELKSISNYILSNNIIAELRKIKIDEGLSNEEQVLNYLINVSNNLNNFLNDFKAKEEFSTRLTIKKDDLSKLNVISKFLIKELNSSNSTQDKLKNIAKKIEYFTEIREIIDTKTKLLTIHKSNLDQFEEDYIKKAEEKNILIYAKMTELYNNTASAYNTSNIEKMKGYIKEYKLVCESARIAILSEFKVIISNLSSEFENLYNYENISFEEAKQDLAKAKFHINSTDLEYVEYQQPLNFGSASTKTTVYDHAYTVISIIGFMTILFGMFCAYKLYGRDRKNGKLDILLAQKVKFSEVFAGKFIAILFCTSFVLGIFTAASFIWGSLLYTFLPNSILAVFNLQTAYTIHPFMFLLIKVCGFELQAIFWSIITIFAMNLSRKFEISFALTVAVFVLAVICNLLFNTSLWYCLLPFIHADLTSYLGGATMKTGFLVTSLYSFGDFYISLIYYIVVVALLYNFTKQVFKKN